MSPTTVSSSGPKTCDDFPAVDLKPLRQLPDQSRLNAKDLASKPLQEYYQKANAYMLMDMQEYGIGNGNGLLEAAEVNQFLAKYPSNNPQVNACAMLQEASAFAQIAPALTESFRKSGSITEEFSKIKKDAVQPKEEKSAPWWQILLGLGAVVYVVRKVIN